MKQWVFRALQQGVIENDVQQGFAAISTTTNGVIRRNFIGAEQWNSLWIHFLRLDVDGWRQSGELDEIYSVLINLPCYFGLVYGMYFGIHPGSIIVENFQQHKSYLCKANDAGFSAHTFMLHKHFIYIIKWYSLSLSFLFLANIFEFHPHPGRLTTTNNDDAVYAV